MAQRPVNLSQQVAMTPPPDFFSNTDSLHRSTTLRNAILQCAMYLGSRGYVVMQDSSGGVWVQHGKSPVIVVPPGGLRFGIRGDYATSSPWMRSIHASVRLTGREELDPNVPYVLSAMRLYSGCYSAGLPWSPAEAATPAVIAGSGAQHARVPSDKVAQPLSPSQAHRFWISEYLSPLGCNQPDISNLATKIWHLERDKHLWHKIASFYSPAHESGQSELAITEFLSESANDIEAPTSEVQAPKPRFREHNGPRKLRDNNWRTRPYAKRALASTTIWRAHVIPPPVPIKNSAVENAWQFEEKATPSRWSSFVSTTMQGY